MAPLVPAGDTQSLTDHAGGIRPDSSRISWRLCGYPPSGLTTWSGSVPVHQQADGNFIYYGMREFGMTAMANGIALHGGGLPYTSTFLMFVKYARNAGRMTALMKLRHIMAYTHESIGIGEDAPGHQPVEQLASLRHELTSKATIIHRIQPIIGVTKTGLLK